jgi:NNP family nitrate/nitrite transporter-like MFS transporter
MVAVPTLAGAVLRLVNGVLVDRIGPKFTGVISQVLVISGLCAAWMLGVHSFTQVLMLGVVLGIAGSAVAVALPLASRWYPPEHQGTALGIAGAGNSGTVLASLFAPALAVAFGWNTVVGLAALPLTIALLVYLALAKDSPRQPAPKPLPEYFAILKKPDAWRLMAFYAVTFGGFVGLAASLPTYFHTEYGLSPIKAGLFNAACVFAGSMVRPFGGYLADRFGGIRTLTCTYAAAAIALILVSFGLPHLPMAMVVLVTGMLALGMGNGAVFQLAPQRFPEEIGVITGFVGMAGGVGGFYLASSLGLSKQLTGSYQAGLLAFAVLALVALAGLTWTRRVWRARPATAAA